METHCKPNHERREPSTVNCVDHSGIEMWMHGIGVGVTLCAALLAYSVLWQAPNIRAEVAKEIARLDASDKATGYQIETIKRDITDIKYSLNEIRGK